VKLGFRTFTWRFAVEAASSRAFIAVSDHSRDCFGRSRHFFFLKDFLERLPGSWALRLQLPGRLGRCRFLPDKSLLWSFFRQTWGGCLTPVGEPLSASACFGLSSHSSIILVRTQLAWVRFNQGNLLYSTQIYNLQYLARQMIICRCCIKKRQGQLTSRRTQKTGCTIPSGLNSGPYRLTRSCERALPAASQCVHSEG